MLSLDAFATEIPSMQRVAWQRGGHGILPALPHGVRVGEFTLRYMCLAFLSVALAGCETGPSGVADKVLADFGLRDRPEGYVSGTDRVVERLGAVGTTEMKRMNMKERHGEVKFQDDAGFGGKFYKEVKKYEEANPLDAQPMSRAAAGERGFVGYVEYRYRIYQSERRDTRAEAEALSANIPTEDSGSEVYRYRFNSGGIWDGQEGESSRR